jgi:hypothetical protein
VAVVHRGERGGKVTAVDGGEDRAGARPTVPGGQSARGAHGIGVPVGQHPVVVRGALGGRQQSRGQVVAHLLLGDPGQPGQLHQPPPPLVHLVSIFEGFEVASGDDQQQSL